MNVKFTEWLGHFCDGRVLLVISGWSTLCQLFAPFYHLNFSSLKNSSAPVTVYNMAVTTNAVACVRCSSRKVRCDKQTPCESCVRHSVQCVFPPPKISTKRKSKHEQELEERLARYEAVLLSQGFDPRLAPAQTGARQSPDHGTSDDATADTVSSPGERQRKKSRVETSPQIIQLPTPTSTLSEHQAMLLLPQIVHQQNASKPPEK